jgi:hypothetical protein
MGADLGRPRFRIPFYEHIVRNTMVRRTLWRSMSRNRLGSQRARTAAAKLKPCLEPLEPRALLAVVTVTATQVIRTVNTHLLGVNLTSWDTNLNTARTKTMVQNAGLTMFRFPGGSSSDDWHFNAAPTYSGEGTDSSMASFIVSVKGAGLVTQDYGSGSPQEAAALLAYLDAYVSNTTSIGMGEEWSDSAQAWQQVDWKTAGYWASLRAAKPLAQDDGLNFLRLNHPAPLGINDFEVGNEEYGTWEIDHHTAQHDPTTYIAFAKQFAVYAATIDKGISIGLDVGSPDNSFNNWTDNILKQSASQGFMPGFLSDHNYVQAPGSESDSNLLLHTVSDPSTTLDWAVRAADYENLLQQDLGSAGKTVQLLATEFNSVYSNPGKQTTSLVNGLFVADSLGVLLETRYNGADVWDLRNSWDTSNNNSSSLYGWRQGGDYGILGSPNGSPPSSGTYVPYPTFFAEQLASKIIQAGGKVVQASSNNVNLTAYAVLESNGHLDLLFINKSTSALSGSVKINGFQPSASAQVWRYGEPQDMAQSKTTDGHSALAHFTVTLTLNGSIFNCSFPAYSMTVLDLGPGPGPGILGLTRVGAAAASLTEAPSATGAITASPSAGLGTSGGTGVAAGLVALNWAPLPAPNGTPTLRKARALTALTPAGRQGTAHTLFARNLPAAGRRGLGWDVQGPDATR